MDLFMTQAWTKKYEPKNSGEIIGQEKAVVSLKHFILNLEHSKAEERFGYGGDVKRLSMILTFLKEGLL